MIQHKTIIRSGFIVFLFQILNQVNEFCKSFLL